MLLCALDRPQPPTSVKNSHIFQHVANALEKKPDQFTPLWHWRSVAPGEHANGLEEGKGSGRNLASLEIADKVDWKWEDGVGEIAEKIEKL